VTINDSASLHLTTGMTLEAWVNPSAVNNVGRHVIYKGGDNYYLKGTSTKGSRPATGGTFNGSEIYGTSALTANTWAHLAATYDGAIVRLYVNGVQVISRAQTGNIATSTNPLQIGGNSIYGEYFQGTIDEVRIYNRALSAAEVQTDMITPVGGASANTAPTISNLANQTINETSHTGALAFTVGDVETAAASLTVSGSSSNTALVPNAAIVFGGSGANRTVTVTPAANQSGTATITITVSDGALAASTTFVLSVNSAAGVPSPWQSKDIGAPLVAGGATCHNGTFIIDGAGADIWGTVDQFQYVFQSATGDCEIVARAAAVENTNSQAKAGVMIRESTTSGARYAAVLITPGDGARFQRRSTTGGTTSNTRISGVTAPEWIKITRTGNTLSGFCSSDGATWTKIGTKTISMGSTVTIGMGVSSCSSGTLCSSTIDSVTVTP
jgi:hypothetical protein